MKTHKKFAIAAILIFVLAASTIIAAPPGVINYQAKIADPSTGDPIDAVVNVTVGFWDDSTAGSLLWQETHNAVSIENGQLNLYLGTVVPLPQPVLRDTTPEYVAIKLGDDNWTTPRARLAAVPYALTVTTVDGAEAGQIFGDLIVDGMVESSVGYKFPDGTVQTTARDTPPDYPWIWDGNVLIPVDSYFVVGIGTTNPLEKLHVNGFIKADSGFKFPDGTVQTTAGGGTLDTLPELVWELRDEAIIPVDSYRVVGIGTTAPQEKLHVNGFIQADSGFKFPDGSIQKKAAPKRTWIETDDSLSLIPVDSFRQVGIGTTTPSEMLDVNGFIKSSLGFKFGDGSMLTTASDCGDCGSCWECNDTQTWLADLNHKVGIGTSNPTRELDVVGHIHASDLLSAGNGEEANVYSDPDRGGTVVLKQTNGVTGARLFGTGYTSGGGQIVLCDDDGTSTVSIKGREYSSTANQDQGGAIYLYDDTGHVRIKIDAQEKGQAGTIILYDHDDNQEIIIDAERGDGNPGRIITPVLEITGGSDLSEMFDINGNVSPQPGMLVAIDLDKPGNLGVTTQEYDHTVAGIISGAGDVAVGMLMGQRGSIADGQFPVALTGRVYCLVDASYGAIQAGDMLTTSATPGHAMKADDRNRAYGAVIGKAMTSLEQGQGLVLVLVNLQ